MKYRKKPVVIEAVKWTGHNFCDLTDFMHDAYGVDGTKITITTLEGTMTADVGDWIIKGVKGEFYPCKQEVFEQAFGKVEEPAECQHENWRVAGLAPVGKGVCLDCQKHIDLYVLFENMRKRLQALIDSAESKRAMRVGARDGVAGCSTKPYCFGGKTPDQSEPEVPCAVIGSMCDKSPNQQMAKK